GESARMFEGLQSRLQRVEELSEFTESCRRSLDGLLTALGWRAEEDGEEGLSQDEMTVCPYDAHHQIPKSSFDKHVTSCQLRKLGYSKEEEAEMCDPSFCYDNVLVPTSSIDKGLQKWIIEKARASSSCGREEGQYSEGDYSSSPAEVPQNHKYAVCDLTPADRLAIYDYVVEESTRQRSMPRSGELDNELYVDLAAKLKQGDEQKGPKSHLEMLAEMRDYKRRRQSYRAKNVHITKKSYTENSKVIRDVINVHMEELSRHCLEKDEPEDQRRAHENKRSPSVESRLSCGSYKETDHSRHKRERSWSPRKRKRSRDRERDSGRKRDREDDRHRSYNQRSKPL
uniref:Small nuclear ribonucleoprotein U11/U12 subunit 48 n=1 Tax=Latimeria chalumnae TaxID=7897 RepID=H3A477_LATCH